MEHGARIELRFLEAEPHRGSGSAAQRLVADHPFWRADLFDRLAGKPGAFEAAHFHPLFEGVEPCARVWDTELTPRSVAMAADPAERCRSDMRDGWSGGDRDERDR